MPVNFAISPTGVEPGTAFPCGPTRHPAAPPVVRNSAVRHGSQVIAAAP